MTLATTTSGVARSCIVRDHDGQAVRPPSFRDLEWASGRAAPVRSIGVFWTIILICASGREDAPGELCYGLCAPRDR